MADAEQLAILRQGVGCWNEWRLANSRTPPNLYAANLAGMNLLGANLHGAYLNGANLKGACLEKANLSRSYLVGANLEGVSASDAILRGVDFTDTNLKATDLKRACLDTSEFSWASLEDSNLRQARLVFVELRETDMTRADFTGAEIGWTQFYNVDLGVVKGLGRVRHSGPSDIDIDTMMRSRGKIPVTFLVRAGIQDIFVEYNMSLLSSPGRFYSCFISYSDKDKRFCMRLLRHLQRRGVRVWLFSESARWGESVWGEIDRGIKNYDKLIAVRSKHSLQSGPVLREIERALNREDREGKDNLFPIRIDDYIFAKWQHERKADVLVKVVGDFTGWEHNATKYQRAFHRLLKGLQSQGG